MKKINGFTISFNGSIYISGMPRRRKKVSTHLVCIMRQLKGTKVHLA